MTKVDFLTYQKNTIHMKTTLKENTDQILFSIIAINQIFFFHSYNMLTENLIYIIFSMCAVAAITITLRNIYLYKNLKKKDLIFIFILLLAALIEGITTFLNYEQIGFTFNSYSGTIFIYKSSFFLLATIFFYINLRIISYDNLLNIVRIAGIISAILLLTPLIYYQYIQPSDTKHASFFNPYIYLFFWDDNLSAKTQHAFILFLINFFLIQNIYNKYNNKDFILTVLNSTLIFLIFSKIFIIISVAVYFCFLVFVFTKKNFIITCATLLSIIILLALNSYTIHKFTDNKFSYTNNLLLKFGFFIHYVYPKKFEKQLLEIKQSHLTSNLPRLTSTEDIRDYFDSTTSRIEIAKECLARENNKNFSSIQIRKKTRFEMKKKLHPLLVNDVYFYKNCESTLLQAYFKYGMFAFIIYFIIVFSLFKFIKEKKYRMSFLLFVLITLSSIHQIHLNTVLFFFIAVLYSDLMEKTSASSSLRY